ncbi:MAG: glycosyl hydrolase family 3 [Gammaproteobacteria bacterium HGW-Gammaproteobacteria-1]|nr:MAG: glycosyl hydrolase family 3 [Gammaproteobacteria bacterium HGW-Gammaproteobacteria-1]
MDEKSRYVLQSAIAVAAVVVVVPLLVVALDWRSPLSPDWRYGLLGGLLSATAVFVWIGVFLALGRSRWLQWSGRFVAVVALAAFAAFVMREGRFQWMRYQVLSADPLELEAIGNHIVVGYTDLDELRTLLEKRAVGGVFITARNVRGKTMDMVAAEIAELKKLRQLSGAELVQLWIAADQEGGFVSRLSPPLTQLPPLASIVSANADLAQRTEAIANYARIHATELSQIGVNLNLAPVVDVNHGVINPADKYSRIYSRAIADDPVQIAEVASIYCGELLRAGIHCTAKHFPGIGRVYNDTHQENAALTTSMAELLRTDWIPFQELAKNPGVAIMLSHVHLATVDPENPVSISASVVTDVLRKQWLFDGILITDDFTMAGLYYLDGGMGKAAVSALGAGVDLILVSYEPEQCYPLIYQLLEAKREGRLDLARLESSRSRLMRQYVLDFMTNQD